MRSLFRATFALALLAGGLMAQTQLRVMNQANRSTGTYATADTLITPEIAAGQENIFVTCTLAKRDREDTNTKFDLVFERLVDGVWQEVVRNPVQGGLPSKDGTIKDPTISVGLLEYVGMRVRASLVIPPGANYNVGIVLQANTNFTPPTV